MPALKQSAGLYFQILIDGIGAERAGSGLDDEDAFGAEAGEDLTAALDDFLGSG